MATKNGQLYLCKPAENPDKYFTNFSLLAKNKVFYYDAADGFEFDFAAGLVRCCHGEYVVVARTIQQVSCGCDELKKEMVV